MSWQLTLLNGILRTVAKRALRRTKTPERAVRDFERAARFFFRMPGGVRVERRDVAGPGGPIATERMTCGGAPGDGVILHFHGGGYVAGSPRTHRAMLGRLARLAGLEVVAPDYRLAQDAPFPAAFEDACAVWDALLEEGLAPSRIVLGGDSAGGGLALSLLAELCARGTPPAGLYALSPWTDLTVSGASIEMNAASDAILPRSRLSDLVVIVLAGADPRDPRISPLFARFPGAPPVLLQASETEILLDDTRRMAARLEAEGARVETCLWPGAPHVWQIFDGWIPEARAALTDVADFARQCLKAPPRQAGS